MAELSPPGSQDPRPPAPRLAPAGRTHDVTGPAPSSQSQPWDSGPALSRSYDPTPSRVPHLSGFTILSPPSPGIKHRPFSDVTTPIVREPRPQKLREGPLRLLLIILLRCGHTHPSRLPVGSPQQKPCLHAQTTPHCPLVSLSMWVLIGLPFLRHRP